MFLYHKVSKWLDCSLTPKIPDDVMAFCFNLYDDGNERWSMELIGAGRFDLDDSDWFVWNSSSKWDNVLKEMTGVLKEYLQRGKYAHLLKSKSGVGIGFVDGNIEVLFNR